MNTKTFIFRNSKAATMLRRREYTLGDPKSEVSVRKIVRYTESFRVEDEIKDGQEFNVNESVVSRRGCFAANGRLFQGPSIYDVLFRGVLHGCFGSRG